ncbi:MAG: type VI secretion system tube protein Hcp [Bryobacterales bacterium]|nr:type VI secretion system tube protein Hcp [Bryobacterales bacterium]
MPIYMKFEGAKPAVPGTVKDSGHANWVEATSLQFASHRAISSFGGGGERGTGRVSSGDIVFTMPMNASASAVWSNSIEGTSMKVLVDFLDSGEKKGEVYLSVTLTKAIVASVSVSGDGKGPDGSIMVASLNFERMTYETKGKAAGAP